MENSKKELLKKEIHPNFTCVEVNKDERSMEIKKIVESENTVSPLFVGIVYADDSNSEAGYVTIEESNYGENQMFTSTIAAYDKKAGAISETAFKYGLREIITQLKNNGVKTNLIFVAGLTGKTDRSFLGINVLEVIREMKLKDITVLIEIETKEDDFMALTGYKKDKAKKDKKKKKKKNK